MKEVFRASTFPWFVEETSPDGASGGGKVMKRMRWRELNAGYDGLEVNEVKGIRGDFFFTKMLLTAAERTESNFFSDLQWLKNLLCFIPTADSSLILTIQEGQQQVINNC